MSNSQSKIQITAVIIAVCLVLSIGITAHYVILNGESVSKLNDEKLKTEALLSEKLQLQKEIDKFKIEIANWKGKNSDLDKFLAETTAKLKSKEAQLSQIQRENGSVKNLNKQIAEFKDLRLSLESQVAALNNEVALLRQENGSLKKDNEQANAMIAHLEKENKSLNENLGVLTAMTEDNLILVTKKNDKLTVNSKRAKRINFIFDVPQSSLGNLEFTVVSPKSKVYSKSDGSITYHVLPSDGNPVASLGTNRTFELVQKVEMVFNPKDEITKGVYKIEVHNAGKFIGSMQVKLR